MGGVAANNYTFQLVRCNATCLRKANQSSESYAQTMERACGELGGGMRPVCDFPTRCAHDGRSLYLGQPHHLVRDNENVRRKVLKKEAGGSGGG